MTMTSSSSDPARQANLPPFYTLHFYCDHGFLTVYMQAKLMLMNWLWLWSS
jgi:hypothetical protein